MTEEEWLTASDPNGMLAVPAVVSNERKLRLFGVACARVVLSGVEAVRVQAPWIKDPQLEKAFGAAERYADGRITYPTLHRWGNKVRGVVETRMPGYSEPGTPDPQWPASVVVRHTTFSSANVHAAWVWVIEMLLSRSEHHFGLWGRNLPERLGLLLCDIFGNPFRPVAFDPDWRTSTVLGLAQPMYDTREFSAMPILADALQDAGCGNEDILTHCRRPGPHVRGCWVVDLVLGKS